MSKSTPTPRPWAVIEPAAIDYRAPLIYGADGGSLVAVAEGGGPKRAVDAAEARANAALIVRSVNMHAALLAAVEAYAEARIATPPGWDLMQLAVADKLGDAALRLAAPADGDASPADDNRRERAMERGRG